MEPTPRCLCMRRATCALILLSVKGAVGGSCVVAVRGCGWSCRLMDAVVGVVAGGCCVAAMAGFASVGLLRRVDSSRRWTVSSVVRCVGSPVASGGPRCVRCYGFLRRWTVASVDGWLRMCCFFLFPSLRVTLCSSTCAAHRVCEKHLAPRFFLFVPFCLLSFLIPSLFVCLLRCVPLFFFFRCCAVPVVRRPAVLVVLDVARGGAGRFFFFPATGVPPPLPPRRLLPSHPLPPRRWALSGVVDGAPRPGRGARASVPRQTRCTRGGPRGGWDAGVPRTRRERRASMVGYEPPTRRVLILSLFLFFFFSRTGRLLHCLVRGQRTRATAPRLVCPSRRPVGAPADAASRSPPAVVAVGGGLFFSVAFRAPTSRPAP